MPNPSKKHICRIDKNKKKAAQQTLFECSNSARGQCKTPRSFLVLPNKSDNFDRFVRIILQHFNATLAEAL
jgi:tRNA1(Val) A37 N6-methylase TrmN6